MSRVPKDYNRIARKFTLAELQNESEDDDFLSLDDLFIGGRVSQKTNYLLGLLSNQGIMLVLKRFKIIELLHEIGLDDISAEIDTTDPHTHRLYIYSGIARPSNIICELVLKKGPILEVNNFSPYLSECNPNLLHIEWLLLQNPRKNFPKDKPRLPGQSYPGLGLGAHLMQLLVFLAKRLQMDGLSCIPRFFHTAFMFTKKFKFVDPANQAIMVGIKKNLLKKYHFHTVSWAANFDCIINSDTNQKFFWKPGYLIFPMNRKLIKYFNTKEYHKQLSHEIKNRHFHLDKKLLLGNIKNHNITLKETINPE